MLRLLALIAHAALFTVLAGWSVPSLAVPISIPVISTFEDPARCDGWTGNMTGVCDQDGTPSVGISWTNAGNLQFNEGSSVEAPDTAIVAPSKFLGDWSALNGIGLIQFDHMVGNSGSNNGNATRNIYLSGPGGSATWTGPVAPAGNFLSTPFQTFTAPLNEGDPAWAVVGSWAALLSNVTSFSIRGGPILIVCRFSRDRAL